MPYLSPYNRRLMSKQFSALGDEELVREVVTGNDDAFNLIYFRYSRHIRSIVTQYVKESTIAKDVTQEVFIKIFTSLKRGQYVDDRKFLPWAQRVAHNHCIDQHRKGKRTVAVQDLCERSYLKTSMDVVRIETLQTNTQLSLLINKLPEEQREVLYYRYFEGMSFKEIAHVTNSSVNTALGRMRYALINLRNISGSVRAMLG
jgi:RNA polymerase sigma factor (sigma-70 family)